MAFWRGTGSAGPIFAGEYGPLRDMWVAAVIPALEIVRGFLHHWFTEIRTIICEQEQLGAAAKTADLSNKTVATALAVWLTGYSGLLPPWLSG